MTLSGPDTAVWHLDSNGTYLLTADSTLRPGSAEESVTSVPGAASGSEPGSSGGESGGLLSGKTRTQVWGTLIFSVVGAYILFHGAKGVVAVSATALGPWAMVLVGGAAIAGAVAAWNYGPPPKPPDPFAVFTEPAQENVAALMRASLGGYTPEEAKKLAVELELQSPERKQAVARELGVEYTTLRQALLNGTYKELVGP